MTLRMPKASAGIRTPSSVDFVRFFASVADDADAADDSTECRVVSLAIWRSQ